MKKLRWSPKIHPQKLVMLYQQYVKDQVDESAVDNVGLALYLRVRDILLISEHKLICPVCGREIKIQSGETACGKSSCTFSIYEEQYRHSWRHRELWCGNALPFFKQYFHDYPVARNIHEKMIAIDTLIHAFHIDIKSQLPNRAVGNNLIEGSHNHVIALLDKLSGIQPDKDMIFKETAEKMWNRRRNV